MRYAISDEYTECIEAGREVMRMRGYGWLLAFVCLVGAGCGGQGSTSVASQAQRLLLEAHPRDAAFTVTFASDSAHGSGTGTLTMAPALVALHVNGNQQVLIDTPDGIIYGRLTNDKLWSVLNDADNGIYANYDTQVWDPSAITMPQLIGSETLAGVATWHIRGGVAAAVYDTTGNAITLPLTEDVWLRQSDSLPLQLVKKGNLSGTSPTGIAFTVSLAATYHFTAWNKGVTITLPAPGDIAASG